MGTKCKCWKFYCSVIQGLMHICLAYWFCLYAKTSLLIQAKSLPWWPRLYFQWSTGQKQLQGAWQAWNNTTSVSGEAGTTLTQLSKPIHMGGGGEMLLCNWIWCQSELYPLGVMLVRLHAWPNYCKLLLPVKQQIAIKLETETMSSSQSSRTNI